MALSKMARSASGEGAVEAGCEGGEAEGKWGDDTAKAPGVEAEQGERDAGFEADAQEFIPRQDFAAKGVDCRTDEDDGPEAHGEDKAEGAVGRCDVADGEGVGRHGKHPVAGEPLFQIEGGRVLFITHRFQGTGNGRGAGAW